MLVRVAVHLHKITERNLIISLGTTEYASQELVRCLVWRKGKPFLRSGYNLVEGVLAYDSDLSGHVNLFDPENMIVAIVRGER